MIPTEKHPVQVSVFVDDFGRKPFEEWFDSLDASLSTRVTKRLKRVRMSNFGDFKGVGEGVCELRLMVGPGLRVYFGRDGDVLVLLLGGGDKSTQSQDIEKAKRRWQEYLALPEESRRP